MEKGIRWVIIGLQLFMAIGSFAGGIPLLITNGFGDPVSELNGHFGSYYIPGIMLVLFLGVGNIIAVYSHWKNKNLSLVISSIFGFGIMIFGITKAYVYGHFGFLEVALMAFGVLVVALNIILGQLRLLRKSS